MKLLSLPKPWLPLLTIQMTDSLEMIGEPAFKGSSFTAQEYTDAWGDDWHTVFMQILHSDGPIDEGVPS